MLCAFYPFSVFVLLKGRSKEDAIRLGQHMADIITANNPKPVKLKFEKVKYFTNLNLFYEFKFLYSLDLFFLLICVIVQIFDKVF